MTSQPGAKRFVRVRQRRRRAVTAGGVILLGATLVVVAVSGINGYYSQTDEALARQDLQAAQRLVRAELDRELRALMTAARFAADSPTLRALVGVPGFDAATLNSQARLLKARAACDAVILLNQRAEPIAYSDGPSPAAADLAAHPAVRSALRGESFGGVAGTQAGIYQLVVLPVRSGEETAGVFLAAAEIGAEAAGRLEESSRCRVFWIGPGGWTASGTTAKLLGPAGRELRDMPPDQPEFVSVAGAPFGALRFPMEGGSASALLLRGSVPPVAPQQLLQQVSALVAGLVLLALAGGWLFAIVLLKRFKALAWMNRWFEADGVLRNAEPNRGVSLEALAAAVPVPVIVFTAQGHCRLMNAAALSLLGYSREQAARTAVGLLFPGQSPDSGPLEIGELLKGSASEPVELSAQCRDGSQKPVLAAAAAFHGASGSAESVVCVLQDQREHRRLGALQQAYDQLKALQAGSIAAAPAPAAAGVKLTGDLLSGLAVEVKNPLAVLLQGISYLQSRASDAQDADVFPMLERAVHRIDKVIVGLAQCTGRPVLRKEPAEIGTVLDAALDQVKDALAAQSIRLIRQDEPRLRPFPMDAQRLTEAFTRILENAVQAMPQGGELTVRCSSKLLTEPGQSVGGRKSDLFKLGQTVVLCEIRDTGVGIPPSRSEDVFKPFVTTKPSGQGFGLGLPIAQAVVEAHGGCIRVESTEGEGTNILVILPAAAQPGPQLKRRILLIDDDVGLCRMMKLNLERMGGFDVTTAFLGQEGVEAALNGNFDLVVTDFQMPDMNGEEVLDAVKKHKPGLPVLLFSIYHDLNMPISAALRAKADGLLPKPIDHPQLYAAIDAALVKARKAPSA